LLGDLPQGSSVRAGRATLATVGLWATISSRLRARKADGGESNVMILGFSVNEDWGQVWRSELQKIMRILIATITAGGGHLQAAAALEEAWHGMRPKDVIERVDLMKFFSPFHKKVVSDGYITLVERAPELWGMLFKKTDDPKLVRRLAKLRRAFPPNSTLRVIKHLKQFKPDVVLCTHYLPVEILGKAREKWDGDMPMAVCVVTDFEAHAFVDGEAVDVYCVAAEETKARLIARGASPESVVVTGIPIAGRFSNAPDALAVRQRMGCAMIWQRCWCWGEDLGWGRWRRFCVSWTRLSSRFKRWWWRGGTRSCGGNWRCATGSIRRTCWDS